MDSPKCFLLKNGWKRPCSGSFSVPMGCGKCGFFSLPPKTKAYWMPHHTQKRPMGLACFAYIRMASGVNVGLHSLSHRLECLVFFCSPKTRKTPRKKTVLLRSTVGAPRRSGHHVRAPRPMVRESCKRSHSSVMASLWPPGRLWFD